MAKFIGLAFRITLPAVQWVGFELFFRQAHRFCVGTAVYHVVIASIGALALSAATCFGCFFVRTDGTTGAAVIDIAAMNVDADVLVIARAERFRFILA